MKAILEFDLSIPEEAEAHQLALDGSKWRSVIEHIANIELRSSAKYGGDKPVKPSEVREMIYQAINDYGLELP